MKYIKKFENIQDYPYTAKVGDIIGCIRTPIVNVGGIPGIKYGEKYEIIKVHIGRYIIDENQNSLHFDVKNIKTGIETHGWGTLLFKPEAEADLEFDANKYNL